MLYSLMLIFGLSSGQEFWKHEWRRCSCVYWHNHYNHHWIACAAAVNCNMRWREQAWNRIYCIEEYLEEYCFKKSTVLRKSGVKGGCLFQHYWGSIIYCAVIRKEKVFGHQHLVLPLYPPFIAHYYLTGLPHRSTVILDASQKVYLNRFITQLRTMLVGVKKISTKLSVL